MPRFNQHIHNVIRLAYHGCTNRPFFHIVLLNNNADRDAQPLEQLGTYDHMPNVYNERLVSFDVERIKYHLAQGVAVSKPVEKLLGLSGLLPVHPMNYIEAQRNRKKIQAAAAAAQTEQQNVEQNDQS
uniref:Small ribosomal subunit protein bS16m n=1 Tax=Arion vulgaris TaxID=1028688 RepID=A0A0B6YYU2_9EUPU